MIGLAQLMVVLDLTVMNIALPGYDTAFWWTAGIFAGGVVICGNLLRRGPLLQKRTPSTEDDRATTARTKVNRAPPA